MFPDYSQTFGLVSIRHGRLGARQLDAKANWTKTLAEGMHAGAACHFSCSSSTVAGCVIIKILIDRTEQSELQ